MEFKEEDIADVWNEPPRYAIITGANTGIGYEMSRILAAKGWHVILACRNRQRGISAVNDIISDVGSHARIEFMELDLSSLDSVCNFVRRYSMKLRPLNLLINNAGIMLAPHALTVDGIEQTFQVNFVGPYLLTSLLLPKIRGSASADFPSRVVNVGSVAHRWAPKQGVILNMTTINDPSNYQRWGWYGHSKLALMLYTRKLCRDLMYENVYVNCVHPGVIRSDLFRHEGSPCLTFESLRDSRVAGEYFPPFFGAAGKLINFFAIPFYRSKASGALTPLFAATSPLVTQV
ncbi:hypothetical protein GUITHDRAFT_77282 [Guillardia theta CCMP2712]|uniref:Uncharacterized protein n=1 Tax=Guillardia theta (strain CCMP2712) TaxID=905079 RepID=L1IPY9_GUITC|nr:hypothetical protein GUITHDRAFT_77282 [Guillardia theta CCMP2712]EKX38341.1 hypothetical protein GUITHDRAFT_77282 [Guillardia theta CCMP2712]|eukprot:XP_005825321.1 hypothetical protein GUITHDRAFT_77282 [Guillardia theta CCMP2712]